MRPEGRVLVIESLVAAQNDSPRTTFSDLMMLVGTGGRERARDEWEAILAAAGFALDAVTPTGVALSDSRSTSGRLMRRVVLISSSRWVMRTASVVPCG
jgi:hypothetical protein